MTTDTFISVWLQHNIKTVTDTDRRFSVGTLKYSLKTGKHDKEKRLRAKFSLSKQEAIMICSNLSYWSKE
jgi:hypothetical protein